MRRKRAVQPAESNDDVIDLTVLEDVGVTDDAAFADHVRRWTRDGRSRPPEEEEPPADPWQTPASWPISQQIRRAKREGKRRRAT